MCGRATSATRARATTSFVLTLLFVVPLCVRCDDRGRSFVDDATVRRRTQNTTDDYDVDNYYESYDEDGNYYHENATNMTSMSNCYGNETDCEYYYTYYDDYDGANGTDTYYDEYAKSYYDGANGTNTYYDEYAKTYYDGANGTETYYDGANGDVPASGNELISLNDTASDNDNDNVTNVVGGNETIGNETVGYEGGGDLDKFDGNNVTDDELNATDVVDGNATGDVKDNAGENNYDNVTNVDEGNNNDFDEEEQYYHDVDTNGTANEGDEDEDGDKDGDEDGDEDEDEDGDEDGDEDENGTNQHQYPFPTTKTPTAAPVRAVFTDFPTAERRYTLSPTREKASTPVVSLSTLKTDPAEEASPNRSKLALFALFVTVFVMFAAWTWFQVKNNPNGLCAALCNISFAVLNLLYKIVSFPFCLCVKRSTRNRERRIRDELTQDDMNNFHNELSLELT